MPFNSDQYVASGLFWFTLALVNAGLAQSKQRSGLAWWLGSLLLGPFAKLLIVALPAAGMDTEQGYAPTPTQVAMGIGLILALLLLLGVLAMTGGAGR